MDTEKRSEMNSAEIMTFERSDLAENPWVAGQPPTEEIEIEAYSPQWLKIFEAQKHLIVEALPGVALTIEHIGSTAVPHLPAKPVIDIDLIVPDPEKEEDYMPSLTALGYVLTVRERSWYRHRMLRHCAPRINLHVFGPGCPEHARHILFRDWLCDHPDDRVRYADAKMEAKRGVDNVQSYNRKKQTVVHDIYNKIFTHRGWIAVL